MQTEQDKLQQIADVLRRETLEPAESEAKKLVEQAQSQAEQIVAAARREAESIAEANRETLEQERRVFHTSLEQGAKQGLELLRQSIEATLLKPGLAAVLEKGTADPKLVAALIQSLVAAIEKGGIETRIGAVIAESVDPKGVNELLGKEVLARLEAGSVALGGFSGGVELKLIDGEITLDMTDETLRDLLGRFVRKDFRETYFQG